MINPTVADIGRAVVYSPPGFPPGTRADEGVITSFNNDYVFVLYGRDKSAKATTRINLEWMGETK